MDTSPLSRLPPELRNRIYELALRLPKPFVIFIRRPEGMRGHLGSEDGQGKENPVSLLSTCKAVNKECAQLLYAVNDFTFVDRGAFSALDVLRRFRKLIGDEKSAALRSVLFDAGTIATHTAGYDTMTRLRGCICYFVAEAEARPKCSFHVRVAVKYYENRTYSCWTHKTISLAFHSRSMGRSFANARKAIMEKRDAVKSGGESRGLDEVEETMHQLAKELEARADIAGLHVAFEGGCVHSQS